MCARSAVMGAFLNVKINAAGMKESDFAKEKLHNGAELESKAMALEKEILEIVNSKIQ